MAGGAERQNFEPTDRDKRVRKNPVRAGVFATSVLSLSAIAAACGNGRAETHQTKTPGVPITATQTLSTETPTHEAGECTFEINSEILNTDRLVGGKPYWEVISNDKYSFREEVSFRLTEEEKSLRDVGRENKVILKQISVADPSDVRIIDTKDALFDAIFPPEPNNPNPLKSSRVRTTDGNRIEAFLIASDQDLRTQLDGVDVSSVENGSVIKLNLLRMPFFGKESEARYETFESFTQDSPITDDRAIGVLPGAIFRATDSTCVLGRER